MGRILAIDPGEKRVGLALSDPLKMIATPYTILEYYVYKDLFNRIMEIVKEKDVEIVVVGFPLREDGNKGSGCELAQELVKTLSGNNIKTVLWDERYTSKMAESILRESGIKAKNMKDKIDKIAASLLLENYLRSISGIA